MSQTVTIIGNLAADPQLKFTPAGKACANFSVATSERFKKPDGNWDSKNLTYWNVVCWDRMAENVTDSLRKGDKVVIYGKAYTVSWEDKKTGEKRSRMEVTATEVAVGLSKVSASIARTNNSGGFQSKGSQSENNWDATPDDWSNDAPF